MGQSIPITGLSTPITALSIPITALSTPITAFNELILILHLHNVDILNICTCMKKLGAKKKRFFYKMTAIRT